MLPVNGSREALFAFAQTVTRARPATLEPLVVFPTRSTRSTRAHPAGGAQPWYVPPATRRNFAVDWDSVPESVWARTQLLFVCSPGNPTGASHAAGGVAQAVRTQRPHGFVIASDECYSEIYFRDEAPAGGLEGRHRLGRTDFSA
jgi:N-succinyldiaminopimelate aminotransferase